MAKAGGYEACSVRWGLPRYAHEGQICLLVAWTEHENGIVVYRNTSCIALIHVRMGSAVVLAVKMVGRCQELSGG